MREAPRGAAAECEADFRAFCNRKVHLAPARTILAKSDQILKQHTSLLESSAHAGRTHDSVVAPSSHANANDP
jgi:hypothetical protein